MWYPPQPPLGTVWLTLELWYPVRWLGGLEEVLDLAVEAGRAEDGLFVVLLVKLFLRTFSVVRQRKKEERRKIQFILDH